MTEDKEDLRKKFREDAIKWGKSIGLDNEELSVIICSLEMKFNIIRNGYDNLTELMKNESKRHIEEANKQIKLLESIEGNAEEQKQYMDVLISMIDDIDKIKKKLKLDDTK